MILGKPRDIKNYVCVRSDISKILHSMGFIPEYRETTRDCIYYLKNKEIDEVLTNGI